jgi:NADH-quinone oxidoreductase subunit H
MPDPLFSTGFGLALLLIILIRVIVAFAVLMGAVTMMIWFERKLISDMQNRIGPNRAGPFGTLQTVADGIKLIFKEDLLPERADSFVFKLAPYLSVVPALLIFAIVPVGGVVTIAHHTFDLQVADPPMGILFLLAMSSVAVYGTMLAGWSSGSKYPLLGSVRASAQMVSYEAAMGLAVAAVVLRTGSLSTRTIVDSQAPHFWDWNVFRTGVLPFVIFLIAITAELNRPPFDLTEGEQELVGGFHTEYSSFRFGIFYLAEFMNMITMSAVVVTLFFGGPDGPGFHFLRWVWPILWFAGKTGVFLFTYVWIRAALPRLRYDQLMDFGWKVLIPVALGWLLVIAGILRGRLWGFGILAGCFLAAFALQRAIRVSQARRDLLAGAGRLGAAGTAARTARARSILRAVPGGEPATATPVSGADGADLARSGQSREPEGGDGE